MGARQAGEARGWAQEGPSVVGLCGLAVELSALVPTGRRRSYSAFLLDTVTP